MKSNFSPIINILKLVMPLALTLATSIGINSPARAVKFRFFHSEDTPQEVIDGFKKTGDIWSSKLHDDVSIDIYIHFGTPENPNALGAASANMVGRDYTGFLNYSFLDISSDNDLLAFNNLQKTILRNQGKFNQIINLDIDDFLQADKSGIRFKGS